MSIVVRSPSLAMKIALARLHQRLGMPGLLGLLLLVVAMVTFALVWQQHRRLDVDAVATPVLTPVVAAPPVQATAPVRPSLPPASDVPLLLTSIQRAALEQGLGWPRAEYRLNGLNPPADEMPASLEVRCALKGSYPSIRRFVTALLQDTPALTLREFALSRSSADAGDVEAKLSIVVYLAAGAAPASGSRP